MGKRGKKGGRFGMRKGGRVGVRKDEGIRVGGKKEGARIKRGGRWKG